MHARFNDSRPALKRQIHKISVQYEFHGQSRLIGLLNFDTRTIRQEQRPLFVIRHPHVLPFLAVITNEFDHLAVLNEWKLREEIEATATDDTIFENRKLDRSGLLASFVENVVNPAIPYFK